MKDKKQPLLSICIPTYNRAEILKNVLEHYTQSPEFDEDVEIVIGDNASTDKTEKYCRYFTAQYENITYFRNERNIDNASFPRVLSAGKGIYLKLMNDSLYLTTENLHFMKDAIKRHLTDRKTVFFTGKWLFTQYRRQDVIEGTGCNDYVRIVSTYVTSNNLFGAWREQWQLIQDKTKYSGLLLQQEDWTYQMLCNTPKFVLYNKKIFTASDVPLRIRSGYNWFKVHLDHYYQIMMPYVNMGHISQEVLKADRRNLLRHFKKEIGLALFLNYSKYWRFDTSGSWALFFKYYKNDIFFYCYLIVVALFYITYPVKVYLKRLLKRLGIFDHCKNLIKDK